MEKVQAGVIMFGAGLNKVNAVWEAIERGYEVKVYPTHAELYRKEDNNA